MVIIYIVLEYFENFKQSFLHEILKKLRIFLPVSVKISKLFCQIFNEKKKCNDPNNPKEFKNNIKLSFFFWC